MGSTAPGASQFLFGEPPQYPDGPPSWHGSLIESGQDASGYQYRRNRYYDPATGRFTQEDPLGLAGGLNLYGFAGGDPVNFSDPFGLCPPQDNNWTPACDPAFPAITLDKKIAEVGLAITSAWGVGRALIGRLFARGAAEGAAAALEGTGSTVAGAAEAT